MPYHTMPGRTRPHFLSVYLSVCHVSCVAGQDARGDSQAVQHCQRLHTRGGGAGTSLNTHTHTPCAVRFLHTHTHPSVCLSVCLPIRLSVWCVVCVCHGTHPLCRCGRRISGVRTRERASTGSLTYWLGCLAPRTNGCADTCQTDGQKDRQVCGFKLGWMDGPFVVRAAWKEGRKDGWTGGHTRTSTHSFTLWPQSLTIHLSIYLSTHSLLAGWLAALTHFFLYRSLTRSLFPSIHSCAQAPSLSLSLSLSLCVCVCVRYNNTKDD